MVLDSLLGATLQGRFHLSRLRHRQRAPRAPVRHPHHVHRRRVMAHQRRRERGRPPRPAHSPAWAAWRVRAPRLKLRVTDPHGRRTRHRRRARRQRQRGAAAPRQAGACSRSIGRPFPREKACSEYMSPEAVRMLDRLGVTAALLLGGRRDPQWFERHGRAGRSHLVGRFPEGQGLSIARRELDLALVRAARVRGVDVLEGTSLERLEFGGRTGHGRGDPGPRWRASRVCALAHDRRRRPPLPGRARPRRAAPRMAGSPCIRGACRGRAGDGATAPRCM